MRVGVPLLLVLSFSLVGCLEAGQDESPTPTREALVLTKGLSLEYSEYAVTYDGAFLNAAGAGDLFSLQFNVTEPVTVQGLSLGLRGTFSTPHQSPEMFFMLDFWNDTSTIIKAGGAFGSEMVVASGEMAGASTVVVHDPWDVVTDFIWEDGGAFRMALRSDNAITWGVGSYELVIGGSPLQSIEFSMRLPEGVELASRPQVSVGCRYVEPSSFQGDFVRTYIGPSVFHYASYAFATERGVTAVFFDGPYSLGHRHLAFQLPDGEVVEYKQTGGTARDPALFLLRPDQPGQYEAQVHLSASVGAVSYSLGYCTTPPLLMLDVAG